jgi:hypothetical protein
MAACRLWVVRSVAVAACLALLSGCEVIERALESAAANAPTIKFGTATREQLSSDERGTTLRLMIESRVAASWLDADMAMFHDLKYQCRHGEPHVVVSQTPADTPEMSYRTVHPAGTTFTRIVRCSPPPPYEFTFDPGLTENEAMAVMRERLGPLEGVDTGKHQLTKVAFNERLRKYPAIAQTLGFMVAYRMRACPGGVNLDRVLVGAYPDDDPGKLGRWQNSHVMLAMDAPCRDSDSEPPNTP